ncbi:MAG: sulfatase-like hydrolase/transferase [Acidobacteria bacterium]|nr:sulfatase-like hydrolase/transferase [Acidobacteriota bacterium]
MSILGESPDGYNGRSATGTLPPWRQAREQPGWRVRLADAVVDHRPFSGADGQRQGAVVERHGPAVAGAVLLAGAHVRRQSVVPGDRRHSRRASFFARRADRRDAGRCCPDGRVPGSSDRIAGPGNDPQFSFRERSDLHRRLSHERLRSPGDRQSACPGGRRPGPAVQRDAVEGRRVAWIALVVSLVLLNLSVTFEHVWPTLSVRPAATLSVELAIVALGLIGWQWRGQAVSRRVLRTLAAVWVLLIAGRYVGVTTEGLYGRDVNLYWDVQHMPSVGAMFTRVAESWAVAAGVAVVIGAPLLLYLASRVCLGRLARAAGDPSMRHWLGAAAGLALMLWGAEQTIGWRPADWLRFADPVAPAYAREAYEVAYEASGAGLDALGPPPSIESDLTRVAGADVFVIFMESYGAVSWEVPTLVAPLAASRGQLAENIESTGRRVVSALVESPTFGGESWLAHLSLLSGTEVRDNRTNARLLAQERDTLVTLFQRGGYHAVALVPGMLVAWPEGAFYGYDDVYDYDRLGYKGPPFGWWSVTDQYALAMLDRHEIAPATRTPRFVFFSTISTHAPFTPAPPYQADWKRVLTPRPYDADVLDRAWSEQPDWMNLGPSYVQALRYAYATIGGYLKLRADRDLVLILVGDHQPPSLVSGAGASWNVPVHVIAGRSALLQRLESRRFRAGLDPGAATVATMHGLLPILLDAFGEG